MLAKIFVIFACAAVACAFTCPDDEHSFFHADVATGCTVYHICQNGQLQTMNCPANQAFNHETSQCEDASSVSCVETMDHHHHHHHKRSVEVYHTISLVAVRTKAIELFETIKPILVAAAKDIAPSIYYKFESDYLPSLKRVRDEALPVVYDRLLPRLVSAVGYAQRMAGRLFEKAYQAYEMSNSTHLVLPSMSDLAHDVSNDLKPVIELGRYMSARLLTTKTRGKRSASGPHQIPSILQGFVEPVVKSILSSVGASFDGQEDTVTSKLILPIIYEMLEDPETRFDLMRCWYSTKAAFSPLIWDMLSKQTYNTPEGTVITIPRDTVEKAKSRFQSDVKPIIRKIADKHLSMVLRRSSENVPLILKSIDMMKEAKRPHQGVLKDAILNFVAKHGSLLQTSNSKYVHTYTVTEIQKDLRPIYVSLLQVVMDYFSLNQNHWMNIFLNRDSPIYSAILGSPQYAKPAPQAKGRVVVKKVVYKKA